MNIRTITVISASCLALLTGCSAGEASSPANARSPHGAEPTVRSTPHAVIDHLRVRMPLDAYVPSPRQDAYLKRAEAVIVNRCLRDLGYSKHPLDEKLQESTSPNIFEFYWFPDAQHQGYAATSGLSSVSKWDDAASKTQMALLDGGIKSYGGRKVPRDGCYGQAGRELIQGAEPPNEFKENGMTISRVSDASPRGLLESYISVIRQSLAVEIQQDTRIKKVVSAWSTCMGAQGYHYSTPAEAARGGGRSQSKETAASKSEIATASTDMACKKDVRYLDTVVAVESAYETRYIKQHAKRMAGFQTLRRGWDQNAKRTVE